jgi:hypothetical protein
LLKSKIRRPQWLLWVTVVVAVMLLGMNINSILTGCYHIAEGALSWEPRLIVAGSLQAVGDLILPIFIGTMAINELLSRWQEIHGQDFWSSFGKIRWRSLGLRASISAILSSWVIAFLGLLLAAQLAKNMGASQNFGDFCRVVGFVTIFLGCPLLGGYISGRMSKEKYVLNAAIVGAAMTLFYLVLCGFRRFHVSPFFICYIVIVIPLAISGGAIASIKNRALEETP